MKENALTKKEVNQVKKSRWLRLGLGTVIMVLLGLIYAWSVFAAPLEESFRWTRAQTSGIFSTSIIFFVIGLMVTGFLCRSVSCKRLTFLAGILVFLGFVGSSRITTLTGFYLFYGVLVGSGVGIAYNAMVTSLLSWFPDIKGLASGILMMGFGLGGLILSGLTHQLLLLLGWQKVFFLFGIVFGVFLAVGSLLAVFPSQELIHALLTTKTTATKEQINCSPKQMLSTKNYWFYLVWSTLIMAGGLLIIGHAAPFTEGLGQSSAFAATAAGLLSLFNGIGRVVMGGLTDRFGLRITLPLGAILLFGGGIILLGTLATASVFLLLLGFLFTGLSYGGVPPMATVFATRFYGEKHFAMNYSIVTIGMIPSALLGPTLAARLFMESGSYRWALFAMLAFSVVAFGAATQIKRSDGCER